jgi:diaminohydroxyphosphoribosylaminopyrimidine deaminase/5-amino-6-(5-phosphoribosylamino)uracil reductase
VLTGIGTLLEDDPRLDVRLVETARQPLRVVVDSRLETPPTAKLLAPPGEVLLYAAVPNAQREAALRGTGADIAFFPESERAKVDLAAMLADLAARGINELHVEAGHKLNASLLKAGLVDELLVYLAPKLIGLGREMAAFGPLETLADALELEFREFEAVGRDLRILARPPRRGAF